MTKHIAVLIGGLIVGALVGAQAVHRHMAVKLNGAIAETAALQHAKDKLEEAMRKADNRLEDFDSEASALRRQLRAAQERRAAASEVRAEPDVAFDLSPDDILAAPSEDTRGPAEVPGEGEDMGRSGRSRDDSEFATRRREFAEQMRQRVTDFLGDQMGQARDATEQERLAALQDYFNYMVELRERMRSAQTDEERAEVGDLMRQSGEEAWGLVREQQDLLLRDVAAEYGITDAQKQATFAERVQELRRNPFFSGPFMFSPLGGRGGRGMGPPGFLGPGGPPPQPQ